MTFEESRHKSATFERTSSNFCDLLKNILLCCININFTLYIWPQITYTNQSINWLLDPLFASNACSAARYFTVVTLIAKIDKLSSLFWPTVYKGEENQFVFVAVENFEQKLTPRVNTVLDQSKLYNSKLCQKTIVCELPSSSQQLQSPPRKISKRRNKLRDSLDVNTAG